MKKLLLLLLAGAMLTSTVSCSNATQPDTTTSTTTAVSTQLKDSDPLYNQDYDLDFHTYLTIPALEELELSKTALDTQWEAMKNQIVSAYTTYHPAAEGYLAQTGDKVNIHYKGYAAHESDQISESTLKNMSNYSYDVNG
ncbi:MAG: hypothetical protein IJ955_08425, partial [Oscillospiraceae bacterium]|nr:hypothetical protein [Oscillospiraceae bacterium]